MVEKFRYQPAAEYPGKASVIFYKNGPSVEMNDRGRPEIRIHPDDAPFYMETEINSPMAKLAPGETYAMDTNWFPARAGKEFTGVAEAGIVAEPLQAERTTTGVRILGSFGVFFPGKVVAEFLGANGSPLGSAPLGSADPVEMLRLNQEVQAPAGTVRVKVSLSGESGKNLGVLGETTVAANH